MGIGPDLTGSANRYALQDMMENIVEPSKVISDQYISTQFTMKDGSYRHWPYRERRWLECFIS